MPLDHTTFNLGRHSGFLNGAPNFTQRYQRWGNVPRILYHSGLDELIEYPFTPTRTLGFNLDVLSRVDFTETKTLTSNITQQWAAVDEDVTIKEIFEGELAAQKGFFHRLYTFWRTLLNVNDFMLWRPLDLTDKIYRVRIVNILLNGEDMDGSYVGVLGIDRWLRGPIEVHLKLAPSTPPSATIFGAGNLEAN